MTMRIGHSIKILDATRIDCALFVPEVGIQGQSWHVDVIVYGELNSHGFIADFSSVKKTLKKICDETFDHSLVVPETSKYVQISYPNDESIQVDLRDELNQKWAYLSPMEAVQLVKGSDIRLSQIELFLAEKLHDNLPDNVAEVRVMLREEQKADSVFFRYTHGLFNYDGLCRRIFHGHRSIVEISTNGQYSRELSQYVVDNILGETVHIACEPQLIESAENVSHLISNNHGARIEATAPTTKVLLLPKETSIENIATYVANELCMKLEVKDKLEVRIYEGIHKSASVTAN